MSVPRYMAIHSVAVEVFLSHNKTTENSHIKVTFHQNENIPFSPSFTMPAAFK